MVWTKIDTALNREEIAKIGRRAQDMQPEFKMSPAGKRVEFIFTVKIDPDGDGVRDRYVRVVDWLRNFKSTNTDPGSRYARTFTIETCARKKFRCNELILEEHADGRSVRINDIGYEVFVGSFLGGAAEQIALVNRSGAVTLFQHE